MFRKIYYLVLFFYICLSQTNTVFLLQQLFNKITLQKNTNYSEIQKQNIIELMPLIFSKCFKSNIYYSGNYVKSDKVDIFIGNHFSTVDFLLYATYIKHFDKRDIYVIMKRDLLNIPVFGFVASGSKDLLLHRNIEKDKDNIINFVNKIKSGIVFIFPEGTRKNSKKIVKAQEFSRNNNLPVYENLLFPKMKGIHTIIVELIKNNKMGNIIDINCNLTKFVNKDAYMMDLLKRRVGDAFGVIETYKVPYDDRLYDYEYFKKWFLQIWDKKENILNNMDKYVYRKIIPKLNTSTYIYTILCFFIFTYLNIKTKFLVGIITLLLSYLIIFTTK